jgi:thioredoxin 1
MKKLTSADLGRVKRRGCAVVLFSGQWCGACKAIYPMMEKLASEMMGRVDFFEVDVGDTPQIATDMSVSSLPTVSVWKDGHEEKRFVGMTNEKEVRQAIKTGR